MDLQLPPIYLLPTHLSADEIKKWEDKIPTLTRDVDKTSFIVGKSKCSHGLLVTFPIIDYTPPFEAIFRQICIRSSNWDFKVKCLHVNIVSQKTRARFELRKLRLSTEEIVHTSDEPTSPPARKRRKLRNTEDYAFLSDSSADSDKGSPTSDRGSKKLGGAGDAPRDDSVKVIRLAWLQDSMSRSRLLDHREYLIYEAVREARNTATSSPADLVRRAREVAAASSQLLIPRRGPFRQDRDEGHRFKAPALLSHSTTDEHVIANLPPVPEHLKTKYSCQRPTFVHPPNEAFIDKLKDVRELRAMKGDSVGVRAYSTAIASLSAYPYKLQSPTGKRACATIGQVATLTTIM